MHIYRVEFLNIPKIFPRDSCYLFGLRCKIRPDSALAQKEIRNCFSEFSVLLHQRKPGKRDKTKLLYTPFISEHKLYCKLANSFHYYIMVCLRSASLGKHPFHQPVAAQLCSPYNSAVDCHEGFISYQSLCQKARG